MTVFAVHADFTSGSVEAFGELLGVGGVGFVA